MPHVYWSPDNNCCGMLAFKMHHPSEMSTIPFSDNGHFDEVMQLHWPRIFQLVLVSVRDRELAEDLTQDCFWNAYKGWKWFRGDCKKPASSILAESIICASLSSRR